MLLIIVVFGLSTGRMAVHTVGEAFNALLPMLTLDLVRLMLVAVVAGVGLETGGVAGLAGVGVALAVVEGEGVEADYCS